MVLVGYGGDWVWEIEIDIECICWGGEEISCSGSCVIEGWSFGDRSIGIGEEVGVLSEENLRVSYGVGDEVVWLNEGIVGWIGLIEGYGIRW